MRLTCKRVVEVAPKEVEQHADAGRGESEHEDATETQTRLELVLAAPVRGSNLGEAAPESFQVGTLPLQK